MIGFLTSEPQSGKIRSVNLMMYLLNNRGIIIPKDGRDLYNLNPGSTNIYLVSCSKTKEYRFHKIWTLAKC